MISPAASVIISAVLTWTMLLVAAMARERLWTLEGIKEAVGNRDRPQTPSPFAGRADRAAKNMAENLPLFVAVVLAAWMAGVPVNELALPCTLFVVARLVYAPLYWAGVKYVRTIAWVASVLGIMWTGVLAARGH